jgi:3-phosphoshikimate 1-carboxyvinyltransferase
MLDHPEFAGYPDFLEIVPLERPARAIIDVPPSKSITNRALVLAALASRSQACTIDWVLESEDTEVMLAALRDLGFPVKVRRQTVLGCSDRFVHIGTTPQEAIIPASAADLFVGNSGTTMRFLTALVSLGHGRYRLDGVPRMRERPIEDLLDALRQLGVEASSELGNGCPPVLVHGKGLDGGRVRIKGDVSSQFLSGVLLVAPPARGDVVIEVDGPLVSLPYIQMTVALMRQFGARLEVEEWKRFSIPGRQTYSLSRFAVEPDASSASYFFGAAALAGGEVSIRGLKAGSLQGDVGFVDKLEAMGCLVFREERGITVRGGPLRGIDVDMNAISDCVMTLAAVACFAEGPTTIRNVAHIRHKETDRLSALAAELRRVGAEVGEFPDGLRITPRPLHGAVVETYNDHRMAMSLALIGLRVPGVVIRNPGCVAKTYPRFFHDLERLREKE